ncbi:MAG: bifunctional methylenetetrahydrofolate dehydrogenase/methenyltetrahydrofolate cyclohydrolase FolD [Deltaproteobacteria bacterium]|nr:bifunctional methylenetetrahydrofolate dehydrogenase/methenyltetrahydrofolate cyclohydrolase FolD [Deltaproteobacteria bacterium]MBI3076388.1 bifunctional methylenetetrahydrofolate dehydrogenase/methenyltetrahydrofolate cyclohydrolase FolD [Deltaproteobacteria bacterium]
MAKILEGQALAKQVRAEVAAGVAQFVSRHGFPPGLAFILVGDDPSSHIYVRTKEKVCGEVGIRSEQYLLPAETSQAEVSALVGRLNRDPRVHGVLIQLPLPAQLNSTELLEAVSPEKDVDGFHPTNVGRLVEGRPRFEPCTPLGIIRMLEHYGVTIQGSHAVVVGRSNIVGKPVALMLLHRHATVTICHTRTRDLPDVTRRGDILVAAAGRPGLVKGEMIREGAVVIDVGVNRVDGKLVGDVEFASAEPRAAAISPVPGGVGPMTVAMLMANTLRAARLQAGEAA